ncbi:MAG: hypothetical protein KDC46_00265 [Thermoleophilia bacterium]|nr:hypothetical protein [Thermoleophilia bacterium]
MTRARRQPLLAARSVVARIAFSEPAGITYLAFSPLLVNLGSGTAFDVRLDLHPVARDALAGAGCTVLEGPPLELDPHDQRGDATVIALERELAAGLHAQQVGSGTMPPASFAVAIPDERLAALPAGWLPVFESDRTSVDLDRPGRWECGMPSDLVFGVATYSFAPGARDAADHDHYVALPFSRIYVPQGWTPPPALVDTDGN